MKAIKMLLGALIALMALAGIVAADSTGTTSISASVSGTVNAITLTLPSSPGTFPLTAGHDNLMDLGALTVVTNDNNNPGWQITATASNGGYMKTDADLGGNVYTLADPIKLTCPTSDYNYWGSGGVNCAHGGNLETLTASVPVAVGVAAGTSILMLPCISLSRHLMFRLQAIR